MVIGRMVPASTSAYRRAMHQSVHSSPAVPWALRVVAVPSSDVDFAEYVRDLAGAHLDGPVLEARIRLRYPRARVHPNDLSGRDAVWYAYRDGHWEPGQSS
jgi:hypothetical protein